MIRSLLAFGVVATSLVAMPGAKADGNRGPTELASQLRNLEMRSSHGDIAAFEAQPKLLHDMAAEFSAQDDSVWNLKENVDSAIIYLMSGGSPRAVSRLINRKDLPREEEALVQGVASYVLGRRGEAEKTLGQLDATTLDASIAGQIAFAQSVTEPQKNAERSIAFLNLARLLAPGGLVEEAALRREAVIAGEIGDTNLFLMLARQYVTRFADSMYAPRFMKVLIETPANRNLIANVRELNALSILVSAFPIHSREEAFLSIARAALLNSNISVTCAASDLAQKTGALDSGEEQRYRLYKAAVNMLTDRYDLGLSELKSLDIGRMSEEDRDLALALLKLAGRMREPAVSASRVENEPIAQLSPAGSVKDDADEAIALAEASVGDAQHFLGGGRK